MKDNFSTQAMHYAKCRPEYPQDLFEFIISNIDAKHIAWDCATGNGQAATKLAAYFEKVEATDISQSQLDHAIAIDNIRYSTQPAEKTDFPENYFDLITVAQALHWFNFDEFYAEAKRVIKPQGWIAVWTYALFRISPEIDNVIDEYHFNTMKEYWDPERAYVDNHYSDIPFPVVEIPCPRFEMTYTWAIQDLENYLKTWSSYTKYMSVNMESPLPQLLQHLDPLWGEEKMTVRFPVYLRMGEIHK